VKAEAIAQRMSCAAHRDLGLTSGGPHARHQCASRRVHRCEGLAGHGDGIC
jgi:hypothetical protein